MQASVKAQFWKKSAYLRACFKKNLFSRSSASLSGLVLLTQLNILFLYSNISVLNRAKSTMWTLLTVLLSYLRYSVKMEQAMEQPHRVHHALKGQVRYFTIKALF